MCLSCNLSQAVFNLFSFGIEGCNVLSDETKLDDCLIQESSSPLPPRWMILANPTLMASQLFITPSAQATTKWFISSWNTALISTHQTRTAGKNI